MVREVRLIDDWRSAWKYASVHFQTAGLVLMTIAQVVGDSWNGLPVILQQKLPHATTIALVLFGLGLIGRILKLQEPKTNGNQ